MGESILITGGCGFIGSNLAVALAERGHRVTCFDNLSRRGSEALLRRVLEHGGSYAHGDIRCTEDFGKLRQEFSLLIECSAEPSVLVGVSGSDARYMLSVNLQGAINCFEFARERNLPVLFFSTSRVYPYTRINSCLFDEQATRFEYADERPGISRAGIGIDFPLEGARSLYGVTKLAAELIIQEYAVQYDLPALINRFGVVAGPWQLGKVDQGVFTYWLAGHYFRRPLKYIGYGGRGKQVRDLLHIDDLTDLVVEQLARIREFRGEVFNAGGSRAANLSLLETSEICREITGNVLKIGTEPTTRPADVIWYITDNGSTETVFDWQPRRDARAILSDTFDWLRANEKQFKLLLG